MFSGASILLLIAVLIVVGGLGGELAKRCRLPALIGQIVVGVILGEGFLHMVPASESGIFDSHVTFALSLIAVTIGGHLEFRRLHNAKRRILMVSVLQTTVTFAVVFVAVHGINPLRLDAAAALPIHLVMASIATSTSPASTIHIIKEKRAQGLLVKTTIAVIAVNNLITIAIFAVCRALSADMLTSSQGMMNVLLPSALGVLLSLAIGFLTGAALVGYCTYVTRRHDKEENLSRHEKAFLQAGLFTGFLVAICVAAGACEFIGANVKGGYLHPSPILANMMLGLVLANRSSFKEELLSFFQVLEGPIFILFFVLAGSHVSLDAAQHAWQAAALFFGARMAAKIAGGYVGGRLSQSTPKMSHNIGKMLTAQGAIAIALIIVIQQDPAFAEYAKAVTACVLSAVVAAELFSAVLISRTLDQTRESSRDRMRLIEFLQEQYIVPRLYAKDKWEALEDLAHFMWRTHKMEIPLEEVVEAVRAREESLSTAVGHGVAVPHAKIPEGKSVVGALALLDPPLDFDAPDGEPVRLLIMIATPEELAHKHLEVIASIGRMMKDERIRQAIFNAKTAEEIHEIIDSEEAETFNYFVET